MKVENLEKLVTKVYDSLKNYSNFSVNRHKIYNQYCLIVNDLVSNNEYFLDFFDNKIVINKYIFNKYYYDSEIIYYYCPSYNQLLTLIYTSLTREEE